MKFRWFKCMAASTLTAALLLAAVPSALRADRAPEPGSGLSPAVQLYDGAAQLADEPKDHNVHCDLEWSFPCIDGSVVTQDTYKDKIKILIGFRADGACSNCNTVLKEMLESQWLGSDKVKTVCIGFSGGYYDDTEALTKNYVSWLGAGAEKLVFCYTDSSAFFDKIVYPVRDCIKETPSNTIYTPFIVIIDGNDNIRFKFESYQSPATLASALAAIDAGIFSDSGSAYSISGSLDMAKLTKEEIAELLKENPRDLPDKIFDEMPSCDAPYATGKVTTEALQITANRLSALRRLAGLPAVTLDIGLSEDAQYGAVICGHMGTIDHHPSKPDDMEQDFYERAYDATSTSNLYAGRGLTAAVDGFMDDPGASNLTTLGHRRWQLNPALGKVGFGYVENDSYYGEYVVEKVFDKSGAGCNYDFISWPASGNFPNTQFGGGVAWSVTVNPNKFRAPDISSVQVTLRSEKDGKSWTFAGTGYNSAEQKYFGINNVGYGVSNCIIFRPDEVTAYDGVYTVEIKGLKTVSGADAVISYTVDFFNPASVGVTPTPTATATPIPTAAPTANPTAEPTSNPTGEPTAKPTAEPTDGPTAGPTQTPGETPSDTPTAAPTGAPTADPGTEHYARGDVDGDGEITVNDALAAIRGAMGLRSLSSAQKEAADVDGDERVMVGDSLIILRAAMELVRL